MVPFTGQLPSTRLATMSANQSPSTGASSWSRSAPTYSTNGRLRSSADVLRPVLASQTVVLLYLSRWARMKLRRSHNRKCRRSHGGSLRSSSPPSATVNSGGSTDGPRSARTWRARLYAARHAHETVEAEVGLGAGVDEVRQ